jgi:hypothetical protein
MDLTKLNFDGYHYDCDTTSCCDSYFYIKDDDEDCWLEVIPLKNTSGLYTVLTVEGCQTVNAELWVIEEDKFVRCV